MAPSVISILVLAAALVLNTSAQRQEKDDVAHSQGILPANEQISVDQSSSVQTRRSDGTITARSGFGSDRFQAPIPPLPPITIDLVDARGRLQVRPNQSVQLQFRVTNHLPEPLFVVFRAIVEREAPLPVRPLPNLRPDRSLILPGGADTVIVTVIAPADAQEGETLTVMLRTFLPSGRGEFRKGAYVRIGNQQVRDTWAPSVWWNYISVCYGAWDQATCNTNTWTIEFTMQDKESGLLSAMTSPRGLTFRELFVSGTREPVKGYYTASCCAPEVELTVEDGDGNRRTDKFNVHSQFLSAGEIMAITFGILSLLLLIAVIVLAICYCRRKRSHSLEPISMRRARQERQERQERSTGSGYS